MKKYICLLAFLTINSISAQTKSSNYFCLYKGGEQYLKPVKYLMFDSINTNNKKTKDKEEIYFQIAKERFKFDKQKHKIKNYSTSILKKIKLEDPAELENDAYKFFKNKKEEVEKKKKIKLLYPPAGYQSYFKIYVLERINDKIIMYEVNWEDSTF